MISGSHKSIARRDLLKSLAGGVLLAPLLRQRVLRAQGNAPKRLILVFTPNSHPREWWPLPAAEAPGFALRGPLLDFSGLEQHMLFVRRVDHSWTFDNHHEAGVAQLFTGQRFFDSATHYANGPSIEQVLLKNTALRAGTPVSDIHLCAADRGGGHKRHVCCYTGPGQPIPREWDPGRAYHRIFEGLRITSTSDNERKRLQRTLELNGAELRRMQAYLGQHERERLEQHVEALRELELQLATPAAAMSGSCQPQPALTPSPNDHDELNIRNWAKLQADIIVDAFSCDRTRVAELGFGFSGSAHIGLMGLETGTRNWHDVAHLSHDDNARALEVTVAGKSVTSSQAYCQFDGLWASQVAYLARRLANAPELDGSMLDNTLIYWGAESGTDHSHSPRDIQYLLIGGRNLGFATGQFLQTAGVHSAHELHTSVLHAFGFEAEGFGIEPACGPLAGVLR